MGGLYEEFDLSTDGEAVAEEFVEAELSCAEIADGAPELLAELADDHRLGVLTNGAGRVQREKFEICGLAGYFDVVVASYEVGAGKPGPEMFEIAKDELSEDERVFLADDFERDILPA